VGPPKYISESEVINIVNDILVEWEKRVGDQRHAENRAKFEKLFAAYNRLIGVGLIFVVLKLIELFEMHSR